MKHIDEKRKRRERPLAPEEQTISPISIVITF